MGVIGSASAGKTALVVQFVKGVFRDTRKGIERRREEREIKERGVNGREANERSKEERELTRGDR